MFRLFYLNLTLSLLTLTFAQVKNCQKKNSCPSYLDYWTIKINPKCDCLPVDEHVSEVAADYIGQSETHTVTTEDGYILTLFRLPRKNPKGVVVLNHPLFTFSRVWLVQGNESTAVWFWQQGYEIWLTNNRGTEYSKRHISLTPDNPKFWDFSIHEIGLYDYKAVFDYIYNITNKTKLITIDHSMGTSVSFIYTALRPEEAKEKLKINIALSPIAGLRNIKAPFAKLAPLAPAVKVINRYIGVYTLCSQSAWYIQLVKFVISHFPLEPLFVACVELESGWTFSNYPPKLARALLPVLSETSIKILYHYAQIRTNNNSEFRMYDYGKKKNIKLYSQEIPPLYPLGKINIPTVLVVSTDDTVSVVKDAEIIYNQLSDEAKVYGKHVVKGLNHIDFHYGKNRRNVVYDKIFELLKKLDK